MSLHPYVGITGFKRRGQVDAILSAVTGPRKLMVGVLASQRTLIQREWNPDGRSPKADYIAEIFPPGDQTLNLVHYYTENQSQLADQLSFALSYGGPHCHGLQLNIAWPDPQVLRDFRLTFPETILVIQLDGRRWPLTDYTPSDLSIQVLKDYDGVADYILFDPSGGLGKEMDLAMVTPYVESLDAHLAVARHRPIGLAVAGGLEAGNLGALQPLCEQIPSLSFDAEGKLHNGPGKLDIEHCRRYLETAGQLPI